MRTSRIHSIKVCSIRAVWSAITLCTLAAPGQSSADLQRRQAIMKPYARTGASYGVDAPLFNISTPFPIGYLPVNLPDRCQQYVGKEVDQMWAFEFWASDCADGWTICVASDAQTYLGEILAGQLRLPVGIRRYLDLQFYWAQAPNVSKYELLSGQIAGADLHIHGHLGDGGRVNFASRIAAGDYPRSKEWAAIVDADSCVATKYATLGYEESFGEAAFLTIFKLNNGFYPQNGDWSCMSGQLDAVGKMDLFSPDVLGGSCAISVSNDGATPFKTNGPKTTIGHTTASGGYTDVTQSFTTAPSALDYALLTEGPNGELPTQYAAVTSGSASLSENTRASSDSRAPLRTPAAANPGSTTTSAFVGKPTTFTADLPINRSRAILNTSGPLVRTFGFAVLAFIVCETL